MFIYVTFDSSGFVTDYKKVKTEGYTKVFVLDSWINQFAQYPDKFRYDSTIQPLSYSILSIWYQSILNILLSPFIVLCRNSYRRIVFCNVTNCWLF